MHEGAEIERPGDHERAPGRTCPGGCVARHGMPVGEEDWVHVGEPLTVAAGGVTAQLCLSVDPDSGEQDGPYVLIGTSEHTPAEAAELGRALMELAAASGDG
ncbi:DUF6907 domain-containing protein [Kocuria sp. NPDC057446]|uniref:DUF6907 domain-containing protein n=1 Tax=Kocuria sp. NPDC057446 TaxID=3346137 RepID=UPI00367AA376